MTWIVFVSQVLLPLGLLIWLARFPAAGKLALITQVLTTAAVLLGIGLAALWTLRPFWVPWLYGLAFILIMGLHALKRRFMGPKLWTKSRVQNALLILNLALSCFALVLAFGALQGRALPQAVIVDIAPPFGPGTYLVAHGGSTEAVNIHLRTLNPTVERFRDWQGQIRALAANSCHAPAQSNLGVILLAKKDLEKATSRSPLQPVACQQFAQ